MQVDPAPLAIPVVWRGMQNPHDCECVPVKEKYLAIQRQPGVRIKSHGGFLSFFYMFNLTFMI